jgi:hypothetical protein
MGICYAPFLRKWRLSHSPEEQDSSDQGGRRELQAIKMNGFTWSETNTGWVVVVGNKGEFW